MSLFPFIIATRKFMNYTGNIRYYQAITNNILSTQLLYSDIIDDTSSDTHHWVKNTFTLMQPCCTYDVHIVYHIYFVCKLVCTCSEYGLVCMLYLYRGAYVSHPSDIFTTYLLQMHNTRNTLCEQI